MKCECATVCAEQCTSWLSVNELLVMTCCIYFSNVTASFFSIRNTQSETSLKQYKLINPLMPLSFQGWNYLWANEIYKA